MKRQTVIRYSNCFKRKVIEELENGRFDNIAQVNSHYGITGAETVKGWLRRFGRNDLCAKVVRVEKPDEKNQIKELKKQIKQLKEALGQTQAEKMVGDEFLAMACERMGIDVEEFEKKADTELFTDAKKQK